MAKLQPMAKLGIAHLSWKRHLQKGLLPHGISLKQMYLLNQLRRRNYLYPAQIAEMLFCDRPTASVIIKNLTRQDWVARSKDPDNAKRVRIAITATGRQKLAAVNKVYRQHLAGSSNPLACFTPEETKQLDNLLSKLLIHLAAFSSE